MMSLFQSIQFTMILIAFSKICTSQFVMSMTRMDAKFL